VIALGIDCATKCGWALVEGPPGADRGQFKVRLSEDEADAAGIAVHLLRKRAWAARTARGH
jgi:hypothetical protein